MSRLVFTDDKLEKRFRHDGYVLLPGLLDTAAMKEIHSICCAFDTEFSTSFHTTHFSRNAAYKQAAHEVICRIAGQKIIPLLKEYRPLFGNFMVKKPDPNTSLDIHSDWTYVDESRFTSVALWSPLIDTTEANGCLGVVNGSHRVTNAIRGPLIRESSRNFNQYWADHYGTLLPMQAGDVIVYHHGLLHFSPPNKTQKIRPAINLTLAPKEAEIIHYCMPEGANNIEQYHVPDSTFYLQYHHFERPQTASPVKQLPPAEVKYIDDRMRHYRWKRWFHLLKQFVTRNP